MFLGHYAVGFASKRVAPRASLAWFVAGATLLDLLFPLFAILGWERAHFVPADAPFLRMSLDDYPWSHSLLMAIVWAVVLGLLCRAVTRDRRAALVAAAAVVSHWVLDLVTHRPDLPLAPGLPARVGLGLWHSTAGTIVVEGLMYVAAIWLYATATRARDRVGSWGLWVFVAFLAIAYASNVMSSTPPDPAVFAWVGFIAGWVMVAWAWWFDGHRSGTSGG